MKICANQLLSLFREILFKTLKNAFQLHAQLAVFSAIFLR